jgi:hypothetical protein
MISGPTTLAGRKVGAQQTFLPYNNKWSHPASYDLRQLLEVYWLDDLAAMTPPYSSRLFLFVFACRLLLTNVQETAKHSTSIEANNAETK